MMDRIVTLGLKIKLHQQLMQMPIPDWKQAKLAFKARTHLKVDALQKIVTKAVTTEEMFEEKKRLFLYLQVTYSIDYYEQGKIPKNWNYFKKFTSGYFDNFCPHSKWPLQDPDFNTNLSVLNQKRPTWVSELIAEYPYGYPYGASRYLKVLAFNGRNMLTTMQIESAAELQEIFSERTRFLFFLRFITYSEKKYCTKAVMSLIEIELVIPERIDYIRAALRFFADPIPREKRIDSQ